MKSRVINIEYTNQYLIIFISNDTATSEISTISLHDALPISSVIIPLAKENKDDPFFADVYELAINGVEISPTRTRPRRTDRKSTRLNSSHITISYAVFCLKKKNNIYIIHGQR